MENYDRRLQDALSHFNHHIHPLVNPDDDSEEGERQSFQSCRPRLKEGQKNDLQACKAGFPLEVEITEVPLLICDCIAQARALPTSGPRSMLGDVLPRRNGAWLNADHSIFNGLSPTSRKSPRAFCGGSASGLTPTAQSCGRIRSTQ